jgi:hypothetical protein
MSEIGTKRTNSIAAVMSANDPLRTSSEVAAQRFRLKAASEVKPRLLFHP